MSDIGMIPVDWEARFDPQRMLRERLQRAKDALNNSDLSMMEITSADGSTSAIFEVHDTEANSAPAKSELIFNKYGNRYFLAKLFDEGNPDGSTVDESHYEKTVSQANVEAQAHVPALHHGQPGN